MKSSNKKHYIFIFIIVFFIFGFTRRVYADIYINEIQVLPTSERFIELYNSSDSSVLLTGYYLQRKTENGTSFTSMVSKTFFDGVEIDGKGYLVISKTSDISSDILVDNLILTQSNTIQLKKSSSEVIDFIEFGDITEGKSYQRFGDDWLLSYPTPGSSNYFSEESDDDSDEESSDKNYIYSSTVKEKDSKNTTTTAEIITNKITLVGLSLPITSKIINSKGITLNVGKFVWNFGDGEGKVEYSVSKLNHIYKYPGEYLVTLNYYKEDGGSLIASDRINIKVIPSSLFIKSIGDFYDPYIEIENKSEYEIDLSGWIIKGMTKNFIIPEGTILLPNKIIKISGNITGFNLYDLSKFSILNNDQNEMAYYPYKIINQKKEIILKNENYENNNTEDYINLNDEVLPNGNDVKNFNNYYLILCLFFVIFLGVILVFIIKNKNKKAESFSNDFKIME